MASTRTTLCTIVTTDQEMIKKTELVRSVGVKYNEIFESGLDLIIEEKGLNIEERKD